MRGGRGVVFKGIALLAAGLVATSAPGFRAAAQGDGRAADRYAPRQVLGLAAVTAVAGDERHFLAARADGTVWGWGDNREIPAPVRGLDRVTAVAAGLNHSLAVRADGSVWAWGANGGGALGRAPSAECFYLVSGFAGPALTSGDCDPVPVQVSGLARATAVVGTQGDSLALLADGTVWVWRAESAPARLTGLDEVNALRPAGRQALALRADGTVWILGA